MAFVGFLVLYGFSLLLWQNTKDPATSCSFPILFQDRREGRGGWAREWGMALPTDSHSASLRAPAIFSISF